MEQIARHFAPAPGLMFDRSRSNLNRFGVALFVSLIGISTATGQNYATGLVLAPPDQLQRVKAAPPPPLMIDEGDVNRKKSFTLRDDMPPVGRQLSQSSCVAWATGYALKSYQERLERAWALKKSNGSMDPDHTFSPAFLYHKINRGVDEGATLIEAFEYLCQHGCATMAEMPYDPADFKTQPTEDAINDAERFGLRSFYSINPFQIKDIKRYLRAGDPIVVGAKIDGSFMSLKGKNRGWIIRRTEWLIRFTMPCW